MLTCVENCNDSRNCGRDDDQILTPLMQCSLRRKTMNLIILLCLLARRVSGEDKRK
jgi:hypothetical protein